MRLGLLLCILNIHKWRTDSSDKRKEYRCCIRCGEERWKL